MRREPVDILFVPGAPHISRLALGEVTDDQMPRNPRAVYGLPAVMLVFCAFFIAAGVLTLLGIDVNWNEKTRKLEVKRLGKP